MNVLIQLTACTIDLPAARVQRGEARIRLSDDEVALIEHLSQNPEKAIPTPSLRSAIWGYQDEEEPRSVHGLIEALRHKIELAPQYPDHLIGKKGGSYRLVDAQIFTKGLPEPVETQTWDQLIGRGIYLEQVDDWFYSSKRYLSISGPNGIGKRTLIQTFIESKEIKALKGTFYHCRTIEHALCELAIHLQLALEPTSNGAIDQIGRVLASRKIQILFLNDLRHLGHIFHHAITCWLKLAPDLKIISSNLKAPTNLPGQNIELQPLSAAESMTLFKTIYRHAIPNGADLKLDLLAGLPLSIELYAKHLNSLTSDGLWDGISGLTHACEHSAPTRVLSHTLRWLFSELESEVFRTLARASLFIQSFSLARFIEIFNDGSNPHIHLDALACHGLIHKGFCIDSNEPIYTMHPALRAHCHLKALGAPWHEADQGDYCRFFEIQSTDWAQNVRGNGGAAATQALLAHQNEIFHAIELSTIAPQHLQLILNSHWLALSQGPVSRFQSLAMETPIGDLKPKAHCQLGIYRGELAHLAGHIDEAADFFETALTLAQVHDLDELRIEALARLGSLRLLQGQTNLAHTHLERALKRAKTQAPHLEAFCLERVGILQHISGDISRAKASLETSALLHGQYDNRLGALNAASNLAMLCLEAGALDRVLEPLKRHLDHLHALKHHRSISGLTLNLGLAHQELGDYQAAEAAYRETQNQARSQGNQLHQGLAAARLAFLDVELGALKSASSHAQEACRFFDKLTLPFYQGLGWAIRGVIAGSDAQPLASEEAFGRARVHLRGSGAPTRLEQLSLLQVFADFARHDLGQMAKTSLNTQVIAYLNRASTNPLFTNSSEGRLYLRLVQGAAKQRLSLLLD